MDLSHVAYVKVIGLTVIGCAVTDHTIVDAQDGININGSHHILIQGCQVKDCSGGGIGGYDKYWDATGHNGPLDFITVQGNEISGCAFWCKYLGSGISMCNAKDAGLGKDPSGYNIIVRNNICHGNENKIGEFTKNINDVGTATDGNGIIIDYLVPNNHYPHNVLVEGNLCYDNGGRGIHVFHSDNTTGATTPAGTITATNCMEVGNVASSRATGPTTTRPRTTSPWPATTPGRRRWRCTPAQRRWC